MPVNAVRTLYFSALTLTLMVFGLFWSAVVVRAGTDPAHSAAITDGPFRQAPFELPKQGEAPAKAHHQLK